MICPVCGTENLQGLDECENCGSDLRTADIPQPGTALERQLVDVPLSALGPSNPLSVDPETSLADAVQRMQQAGVGCLVVERDGQIGGILTERDLLVRSEGLRLDGVGVAQLMTPDPVVLHPEDSVAVAIHKMAVGGFRHIPLVENGHATGLVSAGDLFRYILKVLD